jgi:hypothetical protein
MIAFDDIPDENLVANQHDNKIWKHQIIVDDNLDENSHVNQHDNTSWQSTTHMTINMASQEIIQMTSPDYSPEKAKMTTSDDISNNNLDDNPDNNPDASTR